MATFTGARCFLYSYFGTAGQQNLKNLMLWHIMGYKTETEGKKVKMPCCDVPVMAILKEFRSMAFENGGTLGRKAHRACRAADVSELRPACHEVSLRGNPQLCAK